MPAGVPLKNNVCRRCQTAAERQMIYTFQRFRGDSVCEHDAEQDTCFILNIYIHTAAERLREIIVFSIGPDFDLHHVHS